ncbi:MAG: hypothetical protein JW747_00260 [Candidatus Aminicenantes bacterium]|nr:hypothetical protein [Candidatus Aminicenantes bacterium]
MKTREFFLLLLIIAAGIVLTHYENGEMENWKVRWAWDGPFIRLGRAFTFEESGELLPPFSRTLEVVNEHGSVKVLGEARENMTVTLTKTVWRRKEADARRAAERLGLIIRNDGEKVIVSAGRPDLPLRNHETHLTLSVPEGLNVTVRNGHGRVKTFRTGDTVISNSHGRVEAGEVRGTLLLENRHGDVAAVDLSSDCSIRNGHAAVFTARVKGNLKIEHAYGPVTVEDVSGDVTVNAPHSRVTALRLAGTTAVDSSYQTVSLAHTGTVAVRGRHAVVALRSVRGVIDVSNSYGRTEIVDATGRVNILGRNMTVRGEGLTASEIEIATSYGDIILRNFSGRTMIRQKHAAVRLEPSSVAAGIRVEGQYAALELLWPAAARSPIECRARDGDIRWEISETPSLSRSNGLSLLRVFSDLEGMPPVLLSTTHADITVREASPAGEQEP